MNTRIETAIEHWKFVAPLLTPPDNDEDYRMLVDALDTILDAGGSDEANPLAALAVMMGTVVAKYEAINYPMPA